MWVLAVTLCGALISRRFLVQQPWLSSSLSKMWKGEFCLNFLFSFVKLQNNPDLEKFRKNLHLGYRSLVFITKADSSEPPGSTCHVVFPTWPSYPQPPAPKCIMGPGTSQPIYCRRGKRRKDCLYGTIDTWQLHGPHILREIKSCTLKNHLSGYIF